MTAYGNCYKIRSVNFDRVLSNIFTLKLMNILKCINEVLTFLLLRFKSCDVAKVVVIF